MSFPYKKILLVGATSGIGLTLAERFVQNGYFVVAAGRRKEKLENFVQQHGEDRSAAVQFDISKLELVPTFVASVTKSYPDIDCVFINAGIQRRSVFSEPETIDMSSIIEETTVNYLSYVALTKEFLPFFLDKKTQPTAFIFTSSNLALVPILRCSNYCASKAALHHWILCLREQLIDTKIKIIELYPPIVQTELHDEKHQPDIKEGRSFGIPVDEFADEAISKLLAGLDQVPVGLSNITFNSWEKDRQMAFAKLTAMIKASPH